jgi:hypothetical protein
MTILLVDVSAGGNLEGRGVKKGKDLTEILE